MTVSDTLPSAIRRRQTAFFVAVFVLFDIGLFALWLDLYPGGFDFWEAGMLLVFVPLFLQLSFGTVVGVTGFFIRRRGGDSFLISRIVGSEKAIASDVATAVIMPIFNEDVGRVFQGLRRMWDSLQATGEGDGFDIFILSDSNDPNHWIEEEKAWIDLCRSVEGFGRIFYRKRRVSLHHKSGNVADFCRRWGVSYRYMIVLDADSIMTGKAMVRLVKLMEGCQSAGIIQTVPRQALAQSLFARIQQFSTHICGPLFAAGSNYWHLAGGTYWGHNAIIRIRPFMEHCALPELPQKGPFTGRFLSHDSVEAALMRSAGYGVWLAYDVDGSYEEGPPDLVAALERDRRWCLGNLQHITLLAKRAIRTESRIHLLLGIMAYISAPLWMAFILLAAGRTAVAKGQPGPLDNAAALLLFCFVVVMLLTPKVLGWLAAWQRRDSSPAFSNPAKVSASVILETLFTTLMAPIQMLFYTKFVFMALLRIPTLWRTQNRGQRRPGWTDAAIRYVGPSIIAILGGWLAWQVAPLLFFWLTPVLAGLLVAIPISRLTSSVTAGERARQLGLFLVPEEIDVPPELEIAASKASSNQSLFSISDEYRTHFGLLQVILDPYVNAFHTALLRSRPEEPEEKTASFDALEERVLSVGPNSLTPAETSALLWRAESLIALHWKLWSGDSSSLAEWWLRAIRYYNLATDLAARRKAAEGTVSGNRSTDHVAPPLAMELNVHSEG